MILERFNRAFTIFVLAVFAVTSLGFTSVIEVCCPPESSTAAQKNTFPGYCVSCVQTDATDTESVSSSIRCHNNQVIGGRIDVTVVETRLFTTCSRIAEGISVGDIWDDDATKNSSPFSMLPKGSPPLVSKVFLLNSSLLL